MNIPMIEVKNLTKHFGNGGKVVKAVNGIDFKVEAGEAHGFLGPNGAGKTTTIKMLVGGLSITSGTATIKGFDVGSVKANSLIGYVSEQPKFFDMTLHDYLLYMGRLGHLSKAEAMKNSEELILWLGLEEAADRKVNSYSSGMKQKAALAQALIHEPDILILDEPTANLDPMGRAGMVDHIRELVHERGLTVLVSSHILGEVEKLADTVTIINNGEIVLSDHVSAIKDQLVGNHFILETTKNEEILNKLKLLPYVKRIWIDDEDQIQVVSEKDDELQEAVTKLVYESNAMMRSFKQRDISLESIFLRSVSGKGNDEEMEKRREGKGEEKMKKRNEVEMEKGNDRNGGGSDE
jgi:ABC-2 type transport system ATP-binding protein